MHARTTIRVVADRHAPGAARAFLRDRLPAQLDDERRRELELIATELTANAVQHGSNPGDEIELAVEPRGRTLYLSVTDPCRNRRSPTLLAASSEREHGRGLLAVERLADRWGDEITNGRRKVWATIQL